MQQCQAFIFAGEEDFGIVMAEAQACGRPVIAFAKGGALDIVDDGSTGILFEEQSADSLLDGLERFRRMHFDPITLRASALRFRRQRFLAEFSELLDEKAVTQVC
jgi:glycosyltransferase involved in cell wall biosynthesis